MTRHIPLPAAGVLALLAGAVSGCRTQEGASRDPAVLMFDAPYQHFLTAAGAHSGACEVEITAKGDGGTKTDSLSTRVEVDPSGDYRVVRADGWEIVRVDSVSWQRPDARAKFERVDMGARSDLARDAAVAGWRPLLAPFRDRITLEHEKTRTLGDRNLDVYRIVAQPGGGADGGPQLENGEGRVEIDAATGFPVGFDFQGSWNAPAAPPGTGRVTFTVGKLTCGLAGFGEVAEIEAPGPIGPPATAAAKDDPAADAGKAGEDAPEKSGP